MNANINYDEIPDTSAVQEDLLAALSSQQVTVHTNEEPDFDYMENGDVAFVVKNPHNDENLLIELGGEFSVFFGLWHGQYKAVEYDYDRMKKDIAAILEGNAGALSLYADGSRAGPSPRAGYVLVRGGLETDGWQLAEEGTEGKTPAGQGGSEFFYGTRRKIRAL